MEGNLREREGGREGEIFFHCMPAAALISWSILVNCFREGTADCVIKGEKKWKVFQCLRVQQFLLSPINACSFLYTVLAEWFYKSVEDCTDSMPEKRLSNDIAAVVFPPWSRKKSLCMCHMCKCHVIPCLCTLFPHGGHMQSAGKHISWQVIFTCTVCAFFFWDSVSVSLLLDPLQDTFSSLIMSLLFQFLKCVKDFLVIIIIKNDLYGAFQILIYKGKSRGHKKTP